MKKYRSAEKIEMYKNGGFRERYAMDNGNETTLFMNGHKLTRYTYSKNAEYQDGNGATYDHAKKCWIA